MKVELTIPGKPQGKARARVTRNGHAYTPENTVLYENLIKQLYMTQYPQCKPMDEPIQMTVCAYFPIPNSKSKTVKEQMLRNVIKPTVKPDTDNVLKIVADALNGMAYLDDKQIICASVYKYYSDYPRVEVDVSSMDENL